VSAPDVVPFLSPQLASTRTAAINRIVFIVAPSGGRLAVDTASGSQEVPASVAKVRTDLALCKVKVIADPNMKRMDHDRTTHVW
jgi:hypothetical protein